MNTAEVRQGDCRILLDELDPASVDSVVTDPPYGLRERHSQRELEACLRAWLAGEEYEPSKGGGMHRLGWDGALPSPKTWAKVLRVLKPGAYVASFAHPRMLDLATLSMRLGGLEVRDTLCWLYGSGQPKSKDVGRSIRRAAGEVIEVTSVKDGPGKSWTAKGQAGFRSVQVTSVSSGGLADAWDGYGTGLRPCWEPIILARRPTSLAAHQQALATGTGSLNVDGCRGEGSTKWSVKGRFPGNVLVDEVAARLAELPSRAFYCPKASRAERALGLDEPTDHPAVKPLALMRWLVRLVTPVASGGLVLDPYVGSGTTGIAVVKESFSFVGLEADPKWAEQAARRAAHAAQR